MDVDGEGRNGRDADRGELKIRGQADAERRKDQSMDIDSEQVSNPNLI